MNEVVVTLERIETAFMVTVQTPDAESVTTQPRLTVLLGDEISSYS